MSTQTENMQAYGAQLQDPRWRIKRARIIRRDGGRCRNCGSWTNLQVHHRQYRVVLEKGNFMSPWNYPDKCLVTLCTDCHKAGHALYKVPVFNV
jgi:5-methylcytosine-specific restriction endonuclease McrA